MVAISQTAFWNASPWHNISLGVVPKSPINKYPALIDIMIWRWLNGDLNRWLHSSMSPYGNEFKDHRHLCLTCGKHRPHVMLAWRKLTIYGDYLDSSPGATTNRVWNKMPIGMCRIICNGYMSDSCGLMIAQLAIFCGLWNADFVHKTVKYVCYLYHQILKRNSFLTFTFGTRPFPFCRFVDGLATRFDQNYLKTDSI